MDKQSWALAPEASEKSMAKDRFKISLRLRHPSLDPNEISNAFGINPTFSWISGSRAGPVIQKWNVWYGLLAEGVGGDEYEEALKNSVLLLESGKEWLKDVFESEGELDVIFAYWSDLNEGKIFQTDFYPEFFARLSNLKAGMQLDDTDERASN